MKFNKLIPELAVSDINKSLSFYKMLGFKVEYDRNEARFAFLSFQGSQLMIHQRNGEWETGKMEKPYGRGINLQIEVDDIQPLIKKLEKASHGLFQAPEDNWYRQDDKLLGNREFLVMDPDGYLLRFAQDLGEKKAKL